MTISCCIQQTLHLAHKTRKMRKSYNNLSIIIHSTHTTYISLANTYAINNLAANFLLIKSLQVVTQQDRRLLNKILIRHVLYINRVSKVVAIDSFNYVYSLPIVLHCTAQ